MPIKRSATEKETVHSYKVIFEPLLEGGYNVIVPAISEICTFGKTLPEAKMMAMDAIQCFLESARKDRVALPRDIRFSPRVTKMTVRLQPA
jgi:predicted RNase H-like HicB family nuclease